MKQRWEEEVGKDNGYDSKTFLAHPHQRHLSMSCFSFLNIKHSPIMWVGSETLAIELSLHCSQQ